MKLHVAYTLCFFSGQFCHFTTVTTFESSFDLSFWNFRNPITVLLVRYKKKQSNILYTVWCIYMHAWMFNLKLKATCVLTSLFNYISFLVMNVKLYLKFSASYSPNKIWTLFSQDHSFLKSSLSTYMLHRRHNLINQILLFYRTPVHYTTGLYWLLCNQIAERQKTMHELQGAIISYFQ